MTPLAAASFACARRRGGGSITTLVLFPFTCSSLLVSRRTLRVDLAGEPSATPSPGGSPGARRSRVMRSRSRRRGRGRPRDDRRGSTLVALPDGRSLRDGRMGDGVAIASASPETEGGDGRRRVPTGRSHHCRRRGCAETHPRRRRRPGRRGQRSRAARRAVRVSRRRGATARLVCAMATRIGLALCLLPWETSAWRRVGVDAAFVGHPVVTDVAEATRVGIKPTDARRRERRPARHPPGSRARGETTPPAVSRDVRGDGKGRRPGSVARPGQRAVRRRNRRPSRGDGRRARDVDDDGRPISCARRFFPTRGRGVDVRGHSHRATSRTASRR